MLKRLWGEDEGFLTFEWIMLLTVLVIGVIGGLAGLRDAIIHESQGVVGAMTSLDQSYVVQPPLVLSVSSVGGIGNGGIGNDGSGSCTSGASGSEFADSTGFNVSRSVGVLPAATRQAMPFVPTTLRTTSRPQSARNMNRPFSGTTSRAFQTTGNGAEPEMARHHPKATACVRSPKGRRRG